MAKKNCLLVVSANEENLKLGIAGAPETRPWTESTYCPNSIRLFQIWVQATNYTLTLDPIVLSVDARTDKDGIELRYMTKGMGGNFLSFIPLFYISSLSEVILTCLPRNRT